MTVRRLLLPLAIGRDLAPRSARSAWPAELTYAGAFFDRAAGERQTSRSAFIQEAARRELGWPDAAAVDAAVERGRRALAGAGSFEAAELIRIERDARDAGDRRR